MLEYCMPECDHELEGFKMYKNFGEKLLITKDNKRWILDDKYYHRIIFKSFNGKPTVIFAGRQAYMFENESWNIVAVGSSMYICHSSDNIYFHFFGKCRNWLDPNDNHEIKLSKNVYMNHRKQIVNVETNEIIFEDAGTNQINYIFDDLDYIYAHISVFRGVDYWVIIDKKSETKTDFFVSPYVFNIHFTSYCIHPTTKKTYELPIFSSREAKTWWDNDLFYVKARDLHIYGTYKLDRLKYLSSHNKNIMLRCLWLFTQYSNNIKPALLSHYVPKALVLNVLFPYVLV